MKGEWGGLTKEKEKEGKKKRKEKSLKLTPMSRSLDPGLLHAFWEVDSEGAKLKRAKGATSHLPLSPTAKEMRSEPCSVFPLSHFDGKHLPLRVRSLSFTFS